jgi:hypothetical protein
MTWLATSHQFVYICRDEAKSETLRGSTGGTCLLCCSCVIRPLLHVDLLFFRICRFWITNSSPAATSMSVSRVAPSFVAVCLAAAPYVWSSDRLHYIWEVVDEEFETLPADSCRLYLVCGVRREMVVELSASLFVSWWAIYYRTAFDLTFDLGLPLCFFCPVT